MELRRDKKIVPNPCRLIVLVLYEEKIVNLTSQSLAIVWEEDFGLIPRQQQMGMKLRFGIRHDINQIIEIT